MKKENKNKLFEALAWCDWKDKSTEFTLTYMSEIIEGWDESDVANWIFDNSHKRSQWYQDNPDWYKKYE